MRVGIALVASAAFILNAAQAFPDGAPWGSANPLAEQHCETCHFGAEAVRDSAALRIDGLPSSPTPGASYKLRIVFDDPEIVIAGFQLLAHASEGEAGTFTSKQTDIEFAGSAIRSIAPAKNDNGVAWEIKWYSPGVIMAPIVFHVAALAANDDGSPFGDTIHYRSYETTPEK